MLHCTRNLAKKLWTFWSKYKNEKGFVEYNLRNEVSVYEEARNILTHWKRMDTNDKENVLSLLIDLIKIKRKYRKLTPNNRDC